MSVTTQLTQISYADIFNFQILKEEKLFNHKLADMSDVAFLIAGKIASFAINNLKKNLVAWVSYEIKKVN